jgi:hypothetical protein
MEESSSDAEAAFLEEVSAFLSSGDLPTPNASTRLHVAEASPCGRRTSDKQWFKRLTRHQKETLRKQRYQQRLKHERETLRRLVGELSIRLTQLQQRNDVKQCSTVDALVSAHSVWRDLAAMQRDKLLQAEEVQKTLANAVETQAAYLSVLRGLVSENSEGSVALTQETRVAIISSRQVNMQANHALFAEHLRQLQAAYAQVDEVFRGIDVFAAPEGITGKVCGPEKPGSVECFQHFNKLTLPFRFKQTHEAWWSITNLNQWLKDGEGYADLADPDDTVILRIRVLRTLPTGVTVSTVQRYVLRRFVAETQAIFLWKTYSEGEGIFSGMRLEETGWACIQPSPDQESTVIGVSVRQAPMRVGTSTAPEPGEKEFREMMQTLLKENAETITAALSKKLLEETLNDIEV